MREMPGEVQDDFGSALLDVQHGDMPDGAKPFGEGVRPEIWKLVDNHDGDTYRAVYTAAFPEAVYLLHVFKKKSRYRDETPKPDIERVNARFKAAKEHYEKTYLKRSTP